MAAKPKQQKEQVCLLGKQYITVKGLLAYVFRMDSPLPWPA